MTFGEAIEARKDEVISAYRAGASTPEIAKWFGCNGGVVWLKLNDWGQIDKSRLGGSYNLDQYKDTFVKLYNEGMSLQEIAKSLNINPKTASVWCQKFGLDSTRKQKKREVALKDSLNEIRDLYESGTALSTIAKQYGTSDANIRKLFERNKIELIRNRKYHLDETFFEKIDTQEKAWLLGWMYSDGNVLTDRFRIQITDLDVLEQMREILGYDGIISKSCNNSKPEHHKQMYTLAVYSKKMVDDLDRLGCQQRKSKIIQFPHETVVPSHLVSHFVRGFWEGDGSLSRRRNLSWCATITTTRSFCESLAVLMKFDKYGIYPRWKYDPQSPHTLQIWALRDVARFLEWIYRDATCFMERKKKKYDEFLEAVGQLAPQSTQ